MNDSKRSIIPNRQHLTGELSSRVLTIPSVSIGETVTLAPGTSATVELDENSTKMNQIFNFGIPQGPQGPKGEQGAQGIQGVPGAQGETGPQGLQGPKGETGPEGKPFTISKTYDSVEEMNADLDNMENDQYVMIASSVDTEDNAKLYVKRDTEWIFITDFSGAQGIQGEIGPQGPQGEPGPQGIQGIQGIQGEQGIQGPAGTTDYNELSNLPEFKTINLESILGSGNIELSDIKEITETTRIYELEAGVYNIHPDVFVYYNSSSYFRTMSYTILYVNDTFKDEIKSYYTIIRGRWIPTSQDSGPLYLICGLAAASSGDSKMYDIKLELVSNVTKRLGNVKGVNTEITEASYNDYVPSTKAVYDYVNDKLGDIETALAALVTLPTEEEVA